MRRIVTIVAIVAMLATATAGLSLRPALADEQPIAGTVKSVDPAAGTLVVQITTKGKTRDVPIAW